MAPRRPTSKPEDRQLTATELRDGIARLNTRIAKLGDLNVQTVTEYRSPVIVARR
jgi:hypothetical protein